MIRSGNFEQTSWCILSQLVRDSTQYFAATSNLYEVLGANLFSNQLYDSLPDPSLSWIAFSRPVPILTRQPMGRFGQILWASAIASIVGLFHPVPASAYSIPPIEIGSKNVGAADVALAASQIFASDASAVVVLYVRINSGIPAERAVTEMTKVLCTLSSAKRASSFNSKGVSVMAFFTSRSNSLWSNLAVGALESLEKTVSASFSYFAIACSIVWRVLAVGT